MNVATSNSRPTPEVSVCVISYNQAEYILECLEGIRNQNDAPMFEVIIRDDASSDNTGYLVQSFIEKHGLSNFYYYKAPINGGMMDNFTTALSLCRGKFVAFCEGDDYWTDPNKLKKQYDLMCTNPNCTITAHSCSIKGLKGIIKRSFYRGNTIRRFDLREVLSHSSTQFAPTASYMIQREIVKNLPDWFVTAPIGDIFLELLSLKHGYGLYMPDEMSTYRTFSTGSWSSEMKKDRRRSIAYANKMLNIISILEKDEQLKANGLHIFKANLLALLAIDYLMCGEFKNFRTYIENSFLLDSRWQTKTATYLYRMRRTPLVASILYDIKCKYLT